MVSLIYSCSINKLLIDTTFIIGWRRSHRPSLRDISIIDEEEEREDPENIPDPDTVLNTNSNKQLSSPVYTVTK